MYIKEKLKQFENKYPDDVYLWIETLLNMEILYGKSLSKEQIDAVCVDFEDVFCRRNFGDISFVLSRGYDYDILHQQLMLFLKEQKDVEKWTQSKRFWQTYKKYSYNYSTAEKRKELPYGYEKYIPIELVANGIDGMNHYNNLFETSCAEEYNDKKVMDLYHKRKGMEEKLEAYNKSFIFLIPQSSFQIEREASYMKNCIMTRLPQYVDGQWLYVFVRDMDNPDVPLADIIYDIKNDSLEWAITRGHKEVDGILKDAILIYLKNLKDKGELPIKSL